MRCPRRFPCRQNPPVRFLLPSRRPAPVPLSRPVEDHRPREASLPSRRSVRANLKINPKFCFHHDESASETNCDACKLPFCKLCVIPLQGQTLCGPCKNFRIAALGRAPRVLPLAVVSLVVSLVSGPVMLILSLVAIGLHVGEGETGAAVVLCLLAIALPITGLFLAGRALRQIHSPPEVGGTSAGDQRRLCGSGRHAVVRHGDCPCLHQALYRLTMSFH